jgi:hypothetical protein
VVSHEALRNALRRSLGYEFKRQADRVEIFKKRGSTKRVELRRVDMHDEIAARNILRQAGMAADEIDRLIAEQTVKPH